MAEEKVIIELDIKTDKALADTIALRKEALALREEVKAMKGTEAELSEAYTQKNAQLKATEKQLRINENAMAQAITLEKQEVGTIKQLEERNKALAIERGGVNMKTAEGKEKIALINAEINKNNELIIANSDKLKQQKLNVGNYTDSVKDALKQTGLWGGQSQEVLTKIQGGWGKLKDVGGSIGNLFKGAKKDVAETNAVAGQLAPTMVAGGAATTGAAGAMKFLKVAIASTGIGLLLVAISSLVAWFTKSAEGMKVVKVAAAAMGQIFEVTVGTLIKVGGLLKSIFLLDFSQAKKDIEGIGKEWSQVGDNIKSAVDIVKQEIQLTKDKRKQLVEEAEISRDIAKARLDAADKTKTHQERIERLKSSLEGEAKMADAKIKLAQQELDIVESKIKLEESHGKKASGDLKDRQAELKAAQINAEAEEFTRSKRAMSQLTKLQMDLQQEAADNAKAASESRWKNEIGNAEAALMAEKEGTKERLDAQIKLIDVKRDYELSKEKLTKGEIAAINAKAQIDEYKAIQEFQKFKDDELKKQADEQLKVLDLELRAYEATNQSKLESDELLTQASIDEEIKRQSEIQAIQLEQLEIQKNNKLISEEEYKVAVLESDVAFAAQKTELQNQLSEQETARKLADAQYQFELDQSILEQSLFGEFEASLRWMEADQKAEIEFANKTILNEDAKGKAILKINEKYAKAERAIKFAKYQAEMALAGDFAKNVATIAGEQSKIGKQASAAATTISTIQGSVAAFTGMTSSIPGPVGIGLGLAAAAAALVSGYANVKKILSVQSGLPGDSSGGSASGGGASTPSISATAPVQPVSVNPSLGQGIISRQVDNNSSATMKSAFSEALKENPLQPTLVTSDVTLNQQSDSQRLKTASI